MAGPSKYSVPSALERRRLTLASGGVSDTAIIRAYATPNTAGQFTLLRLRKAASLLRLPAPGERVRPVAGTWARGVSSPPQEQTPVLAAHE